jgi:hypothetical protein
VEVGNEQETSSPTNTTEDEQEATSDKPTEEDDVLIDIERILIDVHRSFFEQYEEGKEVNSKLIDQPTLFLGETGCRLRCGSQKAGAKG